VPVWNPLFFLPFPLLPLFPPFLFSSLPSSSLPPLPYPGGWVPRPLNPARESGERGKLAAKWNWVRFPLLWNRTGHYIFVLWFLLSSSFFLFVLAYILSRRILDVDHTSTHDVALVRT